MARLKNRVRNPGETVNELQPIVNDPVDPTSEPVTADVVIKDEPVTEIVAFEPLEASPVVKNTISIDPDITIVPQEPPKIVFNKGLLGDKMVELIYDTFKEQEPDEELFEYLKLNAAKVVNRISPADFLFWKAVLKRLDKIIDKK
jgi:hypothetical protein